jgi:hypothetical protein
MKAKG